MDELTTTNKTSQISQMNAELQNCPGNGQTVPDQSEEATCKDHLQVQQELRQPQISVVRNFRTTTARPQSGKGGLA